MGDNSNARQGSTEKGLSLNCYAPESSVPVAAVGCYLEILRAWLAKGFETKRHSAASVAPQLTSPRRIKASISSAARATQPAINVDGSAGRAGKAPGNTAAMDHDGRLIDVSEGSTSIAPSRRI